MVYRESWVGRYELVGRTRQGLLTDVKHDSRSYEVLNRRVCFGLKDGDLLLGELGWCDCFFASVSYDKQATSHRITCRPN